MENLEISASIRQNLLSAMKWLKFLAVCGTVCMAIVFVAGVVFLFLPDYNGVPGVAVGLVYIVMAFVYIYPLKKTFEIVREVRSALNGNSQTSLEFAALATRSVLKFMGVLTIVALSVYAVVIILAGVVGGILALM